ncbi:MAG: hypothetical protein H6584_06170 [Flavobacteriales bacterium]|nr:hypothetical protein [Flavobacteriales bacterium]
MDIQEIKNSLDIIVVAEHLGIAVNPKRIERYVPSMMIKIQVYSLVKKNK